MSLVLYKGYFRIDFNGSKVFGFGGERVLSPEKIYIGEARELCAKDPDFFHDYEVFQIKDWIL